MRHITVTQLYLSIDGVSPRNQNKHLLTGAKWSKNKQTNGLRTLQTDFLAWLRFVVLTFRALCNAGRVDTIHVQNNTHTIRDQCSSTVLFRMDLVRLWYGTLVRFLCSEMIDEGTTSIVCSYLRIWPYTHFGLTRKATHYAALVETRFFPPWSNYSVRQQQ